MKNPANQQNPDAPVIVTMGDPSGIGPEITRKAWRERDRCALPPFVVVGDPDVYADSAHKGGNTVPVETVRNVSTGKLKFPHALPVIPLECAVPPAPGAPNAANADAIIRSIEQSVRTILNGDACALVTNPIAKAVLYEAGFAHPGHTEFLGVLARELGGAENDAVMMLASDELRVVPATIHIPLQSVPEALSAELIIDITRTTAKSLREDFAIKPPRIAITGLNPHAGEGGAMGDEEARVISPAIESLRKDGLEVSGPHPADTLFHEKARATYDAAIAMYHDQALIPIKTLAFDRGVNVTLGLPFIRTSPDHGTAFDIAGHDKASPESLIEAIKLAHELATNRARWMVESQVENNA